MRAFSLACAAAAAFAARASADLGQLALQKVLQDGLEVFGDTAVGNTDTRSATWMAGLSDNTPLAHLNIPGTHDAATWNYSAATQAALAYATRCDGVTVFPAEVYRCQHHGISAALDAGVRFFDLRFAFDPLDERLVFWHSSALVSAVATVEDVLFAFYDWLDKHPSEALLLSFQYEGGTKANASFDARAQVEMVRVLTSEAAGVYLRQDSGRLGTLGESRGKIVLVRRFDVEGLDDTLPGLHMGPTAWLDNDPKGFALVYNTTTNATAYIEDYYEPDSLGENSTVAVNVAAKFDAVKTHLKLAASSAKEKSGDEADSLFITFASAEHNSNTPPVFPKTMALGNGTIVTPDGGVNHQLVTLLQHMQDSRLGVVVVDFFDEPANLIELILGSQVNDTSRGYRRDLLKH
ncbi:PLC-like phosphodiesterase [Hypomontagnella monticulosa]|nr:PLC-like phosphodiesterase [Hypomontagnella monticulosa]